MFKRKSKKKKEELADVELVGFYSPHWKKAQTEEAVYLPKPRHEKRFEKPKQSVENQYTLQPTASPENRDGNSVQVSTDKQSGQENTTQEQPIITAPIYEVLPQQLTEGASLKQPTDILQQPPQQPTNLGFTNQVLPQQPPNVENTNGGHQELQQAASTGREDSKQVVQQQAKVRIRPPRSLLPLKARSTVHQRSHGMVTTSTSFGAANDLECECEQETVEIEFSGSSTKTYRGMKYPATIIREHTDTITSLRINCSCHPY
jgi:hypothetical protein